MALLGSFGTLVFHVSWGGVFTYSELEETVKGRWANHEPINDTVLSEFLGPGQDGGVIKIYFCPSLGVDPDAGFDLLRELTRSGEHFPIILGGIPLHNSEWYIDGITSSSKTFSPVDGMILRRECDIAVKEYN